MNSALLATSPLAADVWVSEKRANLEALQTVKQEGLVYLSSERTRIMRLSHQEALQTLLTQSRIDTREAAVKSFGDNGLLERELT